MTKKYVYSLPKIRLFIIKKDVYSLSKEMLYKTKYCVCVAACFIAYDCLMCVESMTG